MYVEPRSAGDDAVVAPLRIARPAPNERRPQGQPGGGSGGAARGLRHDPHRGRRALVADHASGHIQTCTTHARSDAACRSSAAPGGNMRVSAVLVPQIRPRAPPSKSVYRGLTLEYPLEYPRPGPGLVPTLSTDQHSTPGPPAADSCR